MAEDHENAAIQEGADIRLLREKYGWTQAELAERAGTSQQTVDRIERGETKHSRALPKIREILGNQVFSSPSHREHQARRRELGLTGLPNTYVPAGGASTPVYILGDRGKLNFVYFGSYAHEDQYVLLVNTKEYPDLRLTDALVVSSNDEVLAPGDVVTYFSKDWIPTSPRTPGEDLEIGKVEAVEGDTVKVRFLGKRTSDDRSDEENETLSRAFWQINCIVQLIRRGRRRHISEIFNP